MAKSRTDEGLDKPWEFFACARGDVIAVVMILTTLAAMALLVWSP